jgi:hypothetical protein
MPAIIHVNDVGTVFEATVEDENGTVLAIGLATTKEMVFQRPDGTTVTKTAALSTDGSDGKMRYIAVSGDLNMAGAWKVQGHVVLNGDWRTDTHHFRVYENLA